MLIINLLPVRQTHCSGRRGYFIEGSPKGFQNFPIHMTSPWNEHETKSWKASRFVGAEMKFPNCRHNVHFFRQKQRVIRLYSPVKVDRPLAGDIIYHQGPLYTFGVVFQSMTNGVVNIFLPFPNLSVRIY